MTTKVIKVDLRHETIGQISPRDQGTQPVKLDILPSGRGLVSGIIKIKYA